MGCDDGPFSIHLSVMSISMGFGTEVDKKAFSSPGL